MPVSRKGVGAAVSGAEITDLTVDTADIADNAVTGAKIAAISDEGVVISHTDGIVLSGNGGKDTLALSNTTANVGLTIGGDTDLYRPSANQWRTDDGLTVGGNFYTEGTQYFGVSSDTNLYRGAANTLKTDDALWVGLHLVVRIGTANEVILGYTDGSTVGPGMTFGSAADTNVYRSAADTLATDDDFLINTAGKGLKWIAGNEQTTVGAFGAASVLPATPTKYLKVKDSAGTTLVVPAYAAS